MVKIVQFLIVSNIILYGISVLGYFADVRIMPFTAPLMLTGLLLWAIYLRETST